MGVLDAEHGIGEVVAVGQRNAQCVGWDFDIQCVHAHVADGAVALNCSHMRVVKHPVSSAVGSGRIPAKIAGRDGLCPGGKTAAKHHQSPEFIPKFHIAFINVTEGTAIYCIVGKWDCALGKYFQNYTQYWSGSFVIKKYGEGKVHKLLHCGVWPPIRNAAPFGIPVSLQIFGHRFP